MAFGFSTGNSIFPITVVPVRTCLWKRIVSISGAFITSGNETSTGLSCSNCTVTFSIFGTSRGFFSGRERKFKASKSIFPTI